MLLKGSYDRDMKNIFHSLSSVGTGFIAAIFPEKCAFCRKLLGRASIARGFCPSCAEKIIYLKNPDISEFAVSFEGAPGKIYCSCRYTGSVKKAIISFKYGGKAYLQRALSWILYHGVSKKVDFSKYDLICAVPASREKISERGYNQAELLAKGLSLKCNIPYRKDILFKSRDLPSQSLLNVEERLNSVKGIFHAGGCGNSSRENDIAGKNIIIVDDVLTTGATIIECARMLWSKGAVDVTAIILATGKRNV